MESTTHLTILAPTMVAPARRQTLSEALTSGTSIGRKPVVPESFRVPVADTGPIDLGSAAVRESLHRSQISAEAIDSLFYAFTYYQGSHFFSPSHAVARRAGLDRAVPIGIQQMCNGVGTALSLSENVAAGQGFTSVIASSDVFAAPGFDRWGADYGIVYGDAATAMIATNQLEVIDRAHGPICTVVATATAALSQLEAMHYAPDMLSLDPARGLPVNVRATKKRYLEHYGKDLLHKSLQRSVEELIDQVTVAATIASAIPDGRVWLPRLLSETIDSIYLPAIRRSTPLQTEPVPETGHLGAGDLTANLADCVADPQNHDATHLFISAGAGFTITVAAITVAPRRES
ncbi:hypothetical protein [Williamsia sp.]|uniref:hypothetical protein n=1 Tax=Williamsia sp. TaxID=1872085 RepID=UPI002F946019